MTIFGTLAERLGKLGMAPGWWAEMQTNRRAAAGLFVVLVLVASYGFLSLRDATERMRATYDRELGRLQRVAAIAEERDWPQRAEAGAMVRAALESRLWAAESDGIARADLQDWVAAIARDIGLSTLDMRIELAAPKSLPPDLRQITATITAQPSEAALIALLERIERAPHLIVIDRLDVKQQPGPFLEMVLIGYARIGHKIAAQVSDKTKTAGRSDLE